MKPKREIPKVVPEHLIQEFIGFMDAAYDDIGDMSDAAMFEFVSGAANQFRKEHNLSGSVNHMLHQYAQIKKGQQA